ncbi:uncharacterized protein I206_107030 [Kwoniella pini CBS 10737]|uniref:Uncharacterized protein n=1 Tax=Kwoniella pini CBS 10737 TaxID=1296096 RepID=A0A1B9HZD2_9TREE|nr:uncharacterized protein I206_05427 [Kwoniella pini CBS 10737]OCF48647.1 hypothetical protein I206_05427 [Kwoniella pini CBS 10737]
MVKLRTFGISLTSLSVIGLSYYYYNHLKLLKLYPTLTVPSKLKISNRKDFPKTTSEWIKCDLGDSWAIKISKNDFKNYLKDTKNDLGIEWNKAFWGNIALKFEGFLWGLLGKHIWNMKSDSKNINIEKDEFKVGNTLLNGLFTIESNSNIPLEDSKNQFTQIIYKWGNLNSTLKSKIIIKGGYHTLSVISKSSLINNSNFTNKNQNLNQDEEEEEEDEIYLIFIAEGLSRFNSNSIINQNDKNINKEKIQYKMNFLDKLFISFHKEYSRILMHLSIKRMGLENKFESVKEWPNGI